VIIGQLGGLAGGFFAGLYYNIALCKCSFGYFILAQSRRGPWERLAFCLRGGTALWLFPPSLKANVLFVGRNKKCDKIKYLWGGYDD